jgi:O-antigen ligase
VLAIALELTFVRSSWLALPIAALAHVAASRGRSARLLLGVGVTVIGLTLILSPVSSTAHQVVDRAATFGHLGSDVSVNSRSSTFSSSFPGAARAPLGHGLGTAGTPSALNTAQADLAVPDDGYLSLIYQVGPVGFLLVVAALLLMVRAAWSAARSGPNQEQGAVLLAMLVFMLVVLGSGDAFYGLGGLTLWFLGGQALRLAHGGQRTSPVVSPSPAAALSARA